MRLLALLGAAHTGTPVGGRYEMTLRTFKNDPLRTQQTDPPKLTLKKSKVFRIGRPAGLSRQ